LNKPKDLEKVSFKGCQFSGSVSDEEYKGETRSRLKYIKPLSAEAREIKEEDLA